MIGGMSPRHRSPASHTSEEETMSKTMLAALTLLAAAACGRGDKRDVASADSLNRDLQLAPVDTSATLNDRPSADTAVTPPPAAAPAPTPAAPKPAAPKPKPKPKPATPAPAPSASSPSPSNPTTSAAPAPAPAPSSASLAAGATF